MGLILVMMSTKIKFKINIATYFLILSFLFTGFIKNIILIYAIVVFHEMGHVFIIKILKYEIEEVTIYPMGGITKINKNVNTPLKHEFLIAIFGIFFQLILEFIFKHFFYFNLITPKTYELFTTYNKIIMLFNLIPIIPLDGYMLVRSFLEIFLSFKLAFYVSFIISIIFIIAFITYNTVYSLNNYLMISFLGYKIINTYRDFKYAYERFLLERYLGDFKYFKIKHERSSNLNLLKKDTYHYFKKKNSIVSESRLLKEKYEG